MKKIEKKYKASELAESFVFRSKLNAKQKVEAAKQLKAARAKLNEQAKDEERMQASIMQLRFQMEDYARSNTYNKDLSFAYFLRNYIKLRYKANKKFAKDINIEETELSQILNNHRAPSEKTIIRIELQSSIPALFWYKLVEKQREHTLQTNKALRETESKHVKNRLVLQF